jgi:hypothetical protein
MVVTETTVHKENGKPLYSWKQQPDETWIRVPVKESENRLMGVIEGEDHFTFRYKITLPKIESEARIWIPVASDDHGKMWSCYPSCQKAEVILQRRASSGMNIYS